MGIRHGRADRERRRVVGDRQVQDPARQRRGPGRDRSAVVELGVTGKTGATGASRAATTADAATMRRQDT
jgi:hypothetical protein